MAIDPIDRTFMQAQLASVQQKKEEEELRRLREEGKIFWEKVSQKEAEVLLVDPKSSLSLVEDAEVPLEKVSLESRGVRERGTKEQVVQESYLGKNVDLKG